MDCNVQVVFFLSLHQVRLDFPSVTAVCPYLIEKIHIV